jgi:hypothetical protein
LGNPGCVISLGAVPNLILLAGLSGWLENAAQNTGSSGFQEIISRYTQLVENVLPDILQKAMVIYIFLILLGILLLLVALVGSIFGRIRRGKKNKPVPTEEIFLPHPSRVDY